MYVGIGTDPNNHSTFPCLAGVGKGPKVIEVHAWSEKRRYIPETERAIGLKLGSKVVHVNVH